MDWQEIDFQSFDWSLSYSELKNAIDETLRMFRIPDKDEIEYYERKATELEEKHYKEEFEKRINEIKNSSIVELEQYFKDYYEHIEAFLKNERVNGFFVVGSAGIGKTFNLIKKLQEKGLKFTIVKGHHTNLSFYRTLYENRERSILIIDDVVSLAQDKEKISLLLGALDDSHMVMWNSSSPLTSDLPREFLFHSKVFVLANEFKENNEFLKALKDRCIFYELKFSREQIIEMLYILAKERNYSLELVDYLKELSENNIIKNLSLRLLDKLYPYCNNGCDWKRLVKDIIEIDEIENIVFELMKSNKTVKEQVKEFIEKTGLSRTTYFYIKAKILGKNTSGYNY
jgi:Cdc6-like AAA superfamily ATPase